MLIEIAPNKHKFLFIFWHIRILQKKLFFILLNQTFFNSKKINIFFIPEMRCFSNLQFEPKHKNVFAYRQHFSWTHRILNTTYFSNLSVCVTFEAQEHTCMQPMGDEISQLSAPSIDAHEHFSPGFLSPLNQCHQWQRYLRWEDPPRSPQKAGIHKDTVFLLLLSGRRQKTADTSIIRKVTG